MRISETTSRISTTELHILWQSLLVFALYAVKKRSHIVEQPLLFRPQFSAYLRYHLFDWIQMETLPISISHTWKICLICLLQLSIQSAFWSCQETWKSIARIIFNANSTCSGFLLTSYFAKLIPQMFMWVVIRTKSMNPNLTMRCFFFFITFIFIKINLHMCSYPNNCARFNYLKDLSLIQFIPLDSVVRKYQDAICDYVIWALFIPMQISTSPSLPTVIPSPSTAVSKSPSSCPGSPSSQSSILFYSFWDPLPQHPYSILETLKNQPTNHSSAPPGHLILRAPRMKRELTTLPLPSSSQWTLFTFQSIQHNWITSRISPAPSTLASKIP